MGAHSVGRVRMLVATFVGDPDAVRVADPSTLGPAVDTLLEPDDVLVTVGSGSKAHVFRPLSGATFKVRTLEDGGSVYDRALCGSGGEMFTAGDADLCKTCSNLLEG